MDKFIRIKTKIDQVEKLITEIKADLDKLAIDKSNQVNIPKLKGDLPTDEQLRSEYETLYGEFLSNNVQEVNNYINSKSKDYLKAFCKANNLPMDTTKLSKIKIADETIQWMRQRKAISRISP